MDVNNQEHIGRCHPASCWRWQLVGLAGRAQWCLSSTHKAVPAQSRRQAVKAKTGRAGGMPYFPKKGSGVRHKAGQRRRSPCLATSTLTKGQLSDEAREVETVPCQGMRQGHSTTRFVIRAEAKGTPTGSGNLNFDHRSAPANQAWLVGER